mmetsp:Transcript_47124/g.123670  ORF Transcript_47124/g.123670 Transcript_47124/m.123670 type:complete len:262 (-) Transcript_47124:187-972(-)
MVSIDLGLFTFTLSPAELRRALANSRLKCLLLPLQAFVRLMLNAYLRAVAVELLASAGSSLRCTPELVAKFVQLASCGCPVVETVCSDLMRGCDGLVACRGHLGQLSIALVTYICRRCRHPSGYLLLCGCGCYCCTCSHLQLTWWPSVCERSLGGMEIGSERVLLAGSLLQLLFENVDRSFHALLECYTLNSQSPILCTKLCNLIHEGTVLLSCLRWDMGAGRLRRERRTWWCSLRSTAQASVVQLQLSDLAFELILPVEV